MSYRRSLHLLLRKVNVSWFRVLSMCLLHSLLLLKKNPLMAPQYKSMEMARASYSYIGPHWRAVKVPNNCNSAYQNCYNNSSQCVLCHFPWFVLMHVHAHARRADAGTSVWERDRWLCSHQNVNMWNPKWERDLVWNEQNAHQGCTALSRWKKNPTVKGRLISLWVNFSIWPTSLRRYVTGVAGMPGY